MSKIVLQGLVTKTGRKAIGSNLTEATVSIYHESSEVASIELQLPSPSIGDKVKVTLEKDK